ncbi:hypothetical protein FACS1894208_00190 [Clostridia bacterium]|nr:hypothetical protein FACS1894208_00190 [Clostridia bacterium]
MSMSDVPLLGKYLEVTGAFGFGEKAGLVVNEALKADKRKLSGSVSRVVGYEVRNCVADVKNSLIPTVFEIPVRRWQSGGTGSYTPWQSMVTLHPGDSAILEACDLYAYLLNNKDTHGLKLANGVIKRSSRGYREVGKLESLTSYTVDDAAFFCFSFSAGCSLRLHDPAVKRSIGYKQDDVWKVKDEYKEYFGFLEMSGVHARRTRRLVQQQVAERVRAGYQLEHGDKTAAG